MPPIRRYQGRDALGRLAPVLAQRALVPAPLFFMEPDYLASGSEGPSPGALVAYQDEEPVAFMPFAMRRGLLPYRIGAVTVARLPYRQLRLMGYHGLGNDHRTLLDEFFKYLTQALRSSYDVVTLSELPRHDPLAEYLLNPPSSVARSFQVVNRVMDSYRTAVGGSFESYLRGQFSSKTRNTLRRKLRQLNDAAGGEVRMRVFTAAEEVPFFLRDAEQVARNTYQWRLGYDVVSATPRLRKKLTHLARSRRLRGYILYAREAPQAYCLGLLHQRKLVQEIIGYDERFAKSSPGTLLLYRILEDLFESKVADELDYGAGFAEYKQMFATSNPMVVYSKMYLNETYPRFLWGLDSSLRWVVANSKPWVARLRRRFLRSPSPEPAITSGHELKTTAPEKVSVT